jgi:hypothetical protein
MHCTIVALRRAAAVFPILAIIGILLSALLPVSAGLRPAFSAAPQSSQPTAIDQDAVYAALAQMPLRFEANRGQVDAAVEFLARGKGYTLFLTPTEAVLALREPLATAAQRAPLLGTLSPEPPGAKRPDAKQSEQVAGERVLRLQLLDANPAPVLKGREELPGKVNYFRGSDPARWHTQIPTYTRVSYVGVYPGIDLEYYGQQEQLEYDFLVAPGADPGVIALAVVGADRVELDDTGDLVLHTRGGTVVQRKPVIYQVVGDARKTIEGSYVLQPGDADAPPTIGFAVGAYDSSRPLVIDPVLTYSTYLGGIGRDLGQAIAVDASGNAYVTGGTTSANFPTTAGAFQVTYDPGFCEGAIGDLCEDAFVTKLIPNTALPPAQQLAYSTYLGGTGSDIGYGIAVDGGGNAYVAGVAGFPDFPTTPGAFQPTFGAIQAAFVTKLSPNGSALVYSTFLSAGDTDSGLAIALLPGCAANCNAYVSGQTNLPTLATPGAFQTTPGGNFDAYVAVLNTGGSNLTYYTESADRIRL